jgi:uncharacterized membrane protein
MKNLQVIKSKSDNIIDQINEELDNVDPLISIFSGSYLIFLAIRKGNYPLGFAGSYLLFRGSEKMGKTPGKSMFSKIFSKGKNVNVRTSIIVNRPVAEVYKAWRKLENLPLFMDHLTKVKVLDELTSEWETNLPGNVGTISWVSEIVNDIPNDRIGWQSKEDSFIKTAGNVHFVDIGGTSTEIHAVISYHPPMGPINEGAAKLLSPFFEEMVTNDIRNFKDYIENIPSN